MYSYSTFSGLNEFRSDAHGEELILVRRILCSPKAVVQKTFAPPPFCPGGPSFETSNATHTAWPIPRAPTLPSPHTTFPQDLLARRMVLCLPVEVPGFLTKPTVSSVIVTRAVSTASSRCLTFPTPPLLILPFFGSQYHYSGRHFSSNTSPFYTSSIQSSEPLLLPAGSKLEGG